MDGKSKPTNYVTPIRAKIVNLFCSETFSNDLIIFAMAPYFRSGFYSISVNTKYRFDTGIIIWDFIQSVYK